MSVRTGSCTYLDSDLLATSFLHYLGFIELRGVTLLTMQPRFRIRGTGQEEEVTFLRWWKCKECTSWKCDTELEYINRV